MTEAPPDLEVLRAALAAAGERADAMAEKAARAWAIASGGEVVIATSRLEIEKLRRALCGQRSERRARPLDRLELQLEELEVAVRKDDLVAERAVARARTTSPTARRRPAREPFPAHPAHASGW